MEYIREKAVFTRPRLLSTSPHSQVIRVSYKLPWNKRKPDDCVLKFFLASSRVAHKKEVEIYGLLKANPRTFQYARPVGYGEWTTEKYYKTIGKNIEPLGDSSSGPTVLVLLLGFVEGITLSEIPPSPAIAAAALSALAGLHETGIVHGDISPENILVSEDETGIKVIWIDYSASWRDASLRQVNWEIARAAEYFEEWCGVPKANLLLPVKIDPYDTVAPLVPIDTIDALPIMDESVKFHDWEYVSEGTHARIFKAKDNEWGGTYCVKVFHSGWMTPFNLERTAYEYLQAAEIVRYIPHVYGYGRRTLPEWGLQVDDDSIYYAIVMEWLGNMRQLSPETVNLTTACGLLKGLYQIHKAGVLHYDLYARNMMVTPVSRTGRAVWIDFSCAHINRESDHAQEFQTAVGMVLETLLEGGRRRGARQMIRAYGLYTSFTHRRTLAISFSLVLLLEGLVSLLYRSLYQPYYPLPLSFGHSVPLNIFSAALILTEASSIHLHNTLFRLAWLMKSLYLLFSGSQTAVMLATGRVFGVYRVWVMVRLVFTLLWLYCCAEDLLWWKEEDLITLPGLKRKRGSSMSSGSSIASGRSTSVSQSESEEEEEEESGSDE